MADDDNDTKTDPDKDKKLYSEDELQQRLNRVGSSEKKDGKRVREAEILEELGVKDLAEAKSLLDGARKAEDERKSEIDKAREEAEKIKGQAEEELRKTREARTQANAERALLRAGLSFPDKASEEEKEKIVNRAIRNLDLGDNPDADTIASAVEDLKKDVPSFFAEQKPGTQEPKPVTSDPGGPPQKVSVGDAQAAAREQLHRNHPELVKPTSGS